METCFNYVYEKGDPKIAFFSSDERKWITKIRKLKDKHPDQVTILKEPEENDGCIYCKLPMSALKLQINTSTGRKMTEEQRQRMAEGRARARQRH